MLCSFFLFSFFTSNRLARSLWRKILVLPATAHRGWKNFGMAKKFPCKSNPKRLRNPFMDLLIAQPVTLTFLKYRINPSSSRFNVIAAMLRP